jgi:hypothetical protein
MKEQGAAVKRLYFMSVLKDEYRRDLERLLFFSPDHVRCADWIRKTIGLFGHPAISSRDGKLRVTFELLAEVQSLFAIEHTPLRDRLVGCVVFFRGRLDRLTIAYLAVAHDHIMSASLRDTPLAIQLCARVMDVAHQINGITALEVINGSGKFIQMSVPQTRRTA